MSEGNETRPTQLVAERIERLERTIAERNKTIDAMQDAINELKDELNSVRNLAMNDIPHVGSPNVNLAPSDIRSYKDEAMRGCATRSY